MMLKILIFVCLATSALAEICCSPSQWEATEIVLQRRGGHSDPKSARLISYDAQNNRTAMQLNRTTYSGEKERLHIISDYVEMKQYVILLDDETCTSEDLYGEFPKRCIKDDDTLLSSGLLGIGEDTLSTSTYLEKDYNGRSEITVTDECVPVMQSKIEGTFTSSETTLYTDVTAGIVDIDVFTPPSYCDEKTPMMQILLKEGKYNKL